MRKAVISLYSKCPNENGQKSLYQSRNGFIYKDAVFDTNRKSLLRHISAEKGLK
nr:MAG TPA: hypothetical protein [Caudoviricetes sp.]